jgi:hypothetical protein
MATDTLQHTLEQSIQSVMAVWTRETIAALKAAIAANDIELSGKLKTSLDGVVSGGNDRIGANIQIIFEQYGRFHDMKYRHKGVANLDAIRDFVRKVGIDKFKSVPGYSLQFSPSTVASKFKKGNGNQYVVNRIAGAIAFSRISPNWKAKKTKEWYNVTIHKRIGQLRSMIITEMEQNLAAEIRKEFNIT